MKMFTAAAAIDAGVVDPEPSSTTSRAEVRRTTIHDRDHKSMGG